VGVPRPRRSPSVAESGVASAIGGHPKTARAPNAIIFCPDRRLWRRGGLQLMVVASTRGGRQASDEAGKRDIHDDQDHEGGCPGGERGRDRGQSPRDVRWPRVRLVDTGWGAWGGWGGWGSNHSAGRGSGKGGEDDPSCFVEVLGTSNGQQPLGGQQPGRQNDLASPRGTSPAACSRRVGTTGVPI
jgi:hypothetical protein